MPYAQITVNMFGDFPKLGVPFWGSLYNKDYNIWGFILGSPHFGKLPFGYGVGFRVQGLGHVRGAPA